MYATYRLNADELNDTFIDALKATFRSQEIVITATDVSDTTAMLLSNPIDRKNLLEAVTAANDGKPLHRTFTWQEYEAMVGELSE